MGIEYNYKGHKLNPDDIAIPCGQISKLYFNDKF